MSIKYNPQKIEKEWQEFWEKNEIFRTPADVNTDNKMYILPQLPYPSGSGLHVGHAEVYTACDIYARYQRMLGKKVLQVIGWDAFGLPAENYAIKTNIHPRVSTNQAIDNFREQIKALGISVDWDREVGSHNPDYYKWTQWFFLLFYKRGLAYRKKQAVNWCDGCKTVLANEQVTNEGTCERCGTVIIQREMEQWYLKITEYADRLLKDLDKIDWPEETKKRQRDWIGRSEGAEVKFKITAPLCRPEQSEGSKDSSTSSQNDNLITVFTTRPDTLFGATFLVLAPESQYLKELRDQIKNWDEVQKYLDETKLKTDLDRQMSKEKTGVELKGLKAINPVNGEELPIFTADYVLGGYGTGAIMAVPAHDQRDFEFAKKFGVKIKQVVCSVILSEANDPSKDSSVALLSQNDSNENELFSGDGISINSDFLNGLTTSEATQKIISYLEEKNLGQRKIQFKLRDWSVSRQRFWGAPIPMLRNDGLHDKKYNYIIIHGFAGNSKYGFKPWLKDELEKIGHQVYNPDLPNTDKPNIEEQAQYILDNAPFKIDENTILVGHSLGGAVIYSLLEKIDKQIYKAVLVDPVYKPEFEDKERPMVVDSSSWKFNWGKIKNNCFEFVILGDKKHQIIKAVHLEELRKLLDGILFLVNPTETHFSNHKAEMVTQEPTVLNACINNGWMPVPEEDLPVILPDDVDFKPTGESPLNYSKEFNKGVEKKYGTGWRREPDTLDTFMCSSWYYYRYLDPHNKKQFASPEALKTWMPVDFYLGGPEHVNGHLLYSRFFTKVLFDAGYINFDEPFTKHRHQGLILGEDSRKMSKRWNNVINPTDVSKEYGADTLRIYEMFMGPLEQDKPWDTNGVKGVRRFMERVWNYSQELNPNSPGDTKLTSELHKLIKKVTEDLETMKYNTAIAAFMSFVNKLYAVKDENKDKNITLTLAEFEILTKLIAPFAPHLAEELWHEVLDKKNTIAFEPWPKYEEKFLQDDEFTLAVQVNGKLRDTMIVPTEITEDEVKTMVLQSEKIKKWLEGKEPKKIIYIKGKLVSIVI